VRVACLAWALERLPHGVAGGMTEAERRHHLRVLRDEPGAVA
jgi:hypothetical protein